MDMRFFTGFLALLIGYWPVYGQQLTDSIAPQLEFEAAEVRKPGIFNTLDPLVSFQMSETFLNRGDVLAAKGQLLHTIKIGPTMAAAYRVLGKICLDLRQYEEAIQHFDKCFELAPNLSRSAYYERAEAHFKLGDASEAGSYLQQFTELKGKSYVNKKLEADTERLYEELLEERKRSIEFLKSMDTTAQVTPVHLEALCTEGDEYLPSLEPGGQSIVFTRYREAYGEDLFRSTQIDGTWQKPGKLTNSLNTTANEGMAQLHASGRSIYFARVGYKSGCDIFQARMDGQGKVYKAEPVRGELNSEKWESQPTISCDGQVLIFSSIRPDGLGGADLYISRKTSQGYWSKPENVGSHINTKGDEEAPYLAPDGLTLYFTSNGHPGMGDGDLFVTKKDPTSGRWTAPQNLGIPYNSPARELGFFVSPDGKNAWFASERRGTKGGLDLYQVTLPEALRPKQMTVIQGWVRDKDSQKPLPGLVSIYQSGQKTSIQTESDGYFAYCFPGGQTYSFAVERPKYHDRIESYLVEEGLPTIELFLDLDPVGMPVAKVAEKAPVNKKVECYFQVNSFSLDKEAKDVLNELTDLLKREQWKVEVVGYADPTGDVAYNMKLSTKRAESVANYLRSKGTTISNVRTEGRGATGKANDSQERRVEVILTRE